MGALRDHLRAGGTISAAVAVVVFASACGGGSGNDARHSAGPLVPTVPAPSTSRPANAMADAVPDLARVRVKFTTVASGLPAAVDVMWRKGDPRMYVVEQSGSVRVVDSSGRPLARPVLTVPVAHGPEQGMFAGAFSPDGTKLYVEYDDPRGHLRVEEFRMQGDVATAGRTVLSQPESLPNHNGEALRFGPDGMLYIGLGDGGGSGDPQNRAQNLGTFLGKILRISPEPVGRSPYAVPADNPFVDRDGARPEIWMYGLRNPWRFSFDDDGTMWIGDPGQDKYDEINVAAPGQAAGENWGWSLREGHHAFKGKAPPGAREPLIEFPHAHTNICSLIGGYVYRGGAIPGLDGAYIHGDACDPAIVATAVAHGKVQGSVTLGSVRRVTSFSEDPSGRLYVVSYTGTVSRMDAAS